MARVVPKWRSSAIPPPRYPQNTRSVPLGGVQARQAQAGKYLGERHKVAKKNCTYNKISFKIHPMNLCPPPPGGKVLSNADRWFTLFCCPMIKNTCQHYLCLCAKDSAIEIIMIQYMTCDGWRGSKSIVLFLHNNFAFFFLAVVCGILESRNCI